MNTLKALIIDDETTAVKTLSLMIKHYIPEIAELQTTTDASGHFTFSNLAPGTYRLDASGTGYLSSQTTFSLSQGQSLGLHAGHAG